MADTKGLFAGKRGPISRSPFSYGIQGTLIGRSALCEGALLAKETVVSAGLVLPAKAPTSVGPVCGVLALCQNGLGRVGCKGLAGVFMRGRKGVAYAAPFSALSGLKHSLTTTGRGFLSLAATAPAGGHKGRGYSI